MIFLFFLWFWFFRNNRHPSHYYFLEMNLDLFHIKLGWIITQSIGFSLLLRRTGDRSSEPAQIMIFLSLTSHLMEELRKKRMQAFVNVLKYPFYQPKKIHPQNKNNFSQGNLCIFLSYAIMS